MNSGPLIEHRPQPNPGPCDLCGKDQVRRWTLWNGENAGLCCVAQGLRFHEDLPDTVGETQARREFVRNRALHETWHGAEWYPLCDFCGPKRP